MKFANTISLALLATGLTSGALAADTVKQAVQDVKKGTFDLLDKNRATIDFDKGSATLKDGEKSDIKALVDAVRSDAKIEKIVVAAWSDNEYPTNKDQTLSKADQDLAKHRADTIKAYIDTLGVKTAVEVYSMAEYPSWIARTFNTKDAKVKGTGTPTNVDDAVLAEVGREIRDAGGPSKAVVFVLHAGEGLSH